MSEVEPRYQDFHAWVSHYRDETAKYLDEGIYEGDDVDLMCKRIDLDTLDELLACWHYATAIGLNKTSEERFAGFKTRPKEIKRQTGLDADLET